MIFDNQLRLTEEILKGYHFQEPFHLYLRKYFKEHKKFGSRDRKLMSNLCYSYFRIGHALEGLSLDARIIISYYLLNNERVPFIKYHKEKSPAFKELPPITEPLEVKINALGIKPEEIFKYEAPLSDEINKDEFALALLTQPDVWIRVNRGFEEGFEQVLNENEIVFEKPEGVTQAYKVPARTNLEHIFKGKNILFEVQDLSSQLIGELFAENGEVWWDCCSGAGGKSLLLKDKLPKAELYVTDMRQTILSSLKERFKLNRIYNYRFMDINLAKMSSDMIVFDPDKKYVHPNHFDNVIADVPCTGSGTWGRNPENLDHFNAKQIEEYQAKQKAIAANALRFLKPGGAFYYITCSVFKAENEDVVNYLKDTFNLQLENTLTVKGYEQGCDSMYAAKLIKA